MSGENNGKDYSSQGSLDYARTHNLKVVLPKANQLQLDIDSDEDWDTFQTNYNLMTYELDMPFRGYTSAPSRSKPEGRHVTVTCKRDLTPVERVAFQAVLGSDTRREIYSLWRIENGEAIPTLFYEKADDSKSEEYPSINRQD